MRDRSLQEVDELAALDRLDTWQRAITARREALCRSGARLRARVEALGG